jgi:hypothetical protein
MAYASQSSLRSWWGPACNGPWVTLSLYGSGRVTVRPAIVDAVKALDKVLQSYNYVTRYADTGAYNCRKVTGGSTYSLHAYAIAMDINWQSNPYSSTLRTDMFRYGDGRMPYRIEAIRTNNGKQVWRWGGWFSGSKDAMHYEITCSPSDIRTGINWSTAQGSGQALSVPQPPPISAGTPSKDDDMTPEQAQTLNEVHWMLSQVKPNADRIPAVQGSVDQISWGVLDSESGLRVQVAELTARVAELEKKLA